MAPDGCPTLDPRVRRTRQLLEQSLAKLLETKDFDQISVNDITELATLNRATFYDHYPDKFALLHAFVAGRFHALLAERQIRYDGTCFSALGTLIQAVCDFSLQMRKFKGLSQSIESSIIELTRHVILEGAARHPPPSGISPELVAATVAWGIYGAVTEWAQTAPRSPQNEFVPAVLRLLAPLLAVTR